MKKLFRIKFNICLLIVLFCLLFVAAFLAYRTTKNCDNGLIGADITELYTDKIVTYNSESASESAKGIDYDACDDYIDKIDNLSTCEDLVAEAASVYLEYLNLVEGKTAEEFTLISEYLAAKKSDHAAYFKIVNTFFVSGATYGDKQAEAVVTFTDGSQAPASVTINNFEYINGDIVATAVFSGEYCCESYSVEQKIYNVAPCKISYRINSVTSCYLSPIKELTGSLIGSLAEDDDIGDVIELYTYITDRSLPGAYTIFGKSLSPFYKVTFYYGTYEISAVKISASCADKTVAEDDAKCLSFDLTISCDVSPENIKPSCYEIYADGQKVAETDLYGNLSAALAVGAYSVKPVFDAKLYSTTVTLSALYVVSAESEFTVDFGFADGYVREYDGNFFELNPSVTSSDGTEAEYLKSITCDGATVEQIVDAGHYVVTITIGSETFTHDMIVSPVTVNVTVDDKSCAYGDPDPQFTYSSDKTLPDGVISLVREDNRIMAYSLSKNYLFNVSCGAFERVKRKITVCVQAFGKYYGDYDSPLYVTLEEGSLAESDSLAAILSAMRASGEDVGNYQISVDYISDRYEITIESSDFLISKKRVAIAVQSVTTVYGDAEAELSALTIYGNTDVSGVASNLYDIISLSRAEGIFAGEYEITAKPEDDNFDVVVVGGTYTINKKQVTVTVADQSKTYGDEDLYACELSADLCYDDTESDIIKFSRSEGEAVGRYPLYAQSANDNYEVTFVFTAEDFSYYIIEKRELTVKAEDFCVAFTKSYAYVTSLYECSIVEGCLAYDDELIVTYALFDGDTAATEQNFAEHFQVGKSLTLTLAFGNDNYDTKGISGTVSVTKIPVSLTGIVTRFVYMGSKIDVFDAKNNICGTDGYGDENSFYAVYERIDEQGLSAAVDDVVNAGEYVVRVVIADDEMFMFDESSAAVYNITVEKMNLSENIVAELCGDGFAVVGKDIKVVIDGYELEPDIVFSRDEVIMDGIDEEGLYTLTITLNESNYCGYKEIEFYAYNDVAPQMEEFSAAYDGLLSEKAEEGREYLKYLTECRKILGSLSEGDKLQLDADPAYTSVVEGFEREYGAFLSERKKNFSIAERIFDGNNSDAQAEETVVLFIVAAVLLKKLLLPR